jgi:peptidyl-dipeptidase Dcp
VRGKDSANRERLALLDYANEGRADQQIKRIEPWDWRYYAEKVRQSKYNLDQAEVKPYFSLDAMVEAIFDCAYRLFGLKFRYQADIPTYHPDVKAYEVYEDLPDGAGERLVGLFLHGKLSPSTR